MEIIIRDQEVGGSNPLAPDNLISTTVLQIKILGRSPMASLFPQLFEAPV